MVTIDYISIDRKVLPMAQPRKYSKEFIIKLTEDYYSKDFRSLIDLSKKYNINSGVIYKILKREGYMIKPKSITNHKRIIDHDYFANMDTEEKAYWLGILTTDGCITKNNQIKLHINASDRNHLIKFRTALKSDYTIIEHRNNSISLEFVSTKIYADLIKYGLIERKTGFTVKAMELSRELERHYWRGCIDGDGCLSEGTLSSKGNKYNYPVLKFCGDFSLVNSFRDFCKLYDCGNTSKVRHIKNEQIVDFSLACNQALKIMNVLYEDSQIYLDRKYLRYNNYVEKYKLSSTNKIT